MTAGGQDVIRGTAVVIDDRIEDAEDAISKILDQLRIAEIPTVKLRGLPSNESLIHWKRIGLIVMDWELTYSTADDETDIPPGIVVPTQLAVETSTKNIEFIRTLLRETALPIFIATNSDVGSIRTALASELVDEGIANSGRVHVFSKGELELKLFDTIGAWITGQPGLEVLEAWKRAAVEAEIAVFHVFSQAEEDWVRSVQRAAMADGGTVAVALRDLLATNIVNRIGPLDLELTDPPVSSLSDAAALRRILHLSAVIPEASLATGEPYTGDLYVADDADEPFPEIRILLTPECDLTRRDGKWRFTYVTAVRAVPTGSPSAKNRAVNVSKPLREHLTMNLLTECGDEYDISLKRWESIWVPGVPAIAVGAPAGGAEQPKAELPTVSIWKGFRRIGRLIDPYLTHLQQAFASATIRKGLPALPDDFYEGW